MAKNKFAHTSGEKGAKSWRKMNLYTLMRKGSFFDEKLMSPWPYADDVPLEGPKTKMVKKWSGNGFGPSHMTCPKSNQKVLKKLSKNGLSKIWGQKIVPKEIKKLFKNCFLGGGRRPQIGVAAFGRPFLVLFVKKRVF